MRMSARNKTKKARFVMVVLLCTEEFGRSGSGAGEGEGWRETSHFSPYLSVQEGTRADSKADRKGANNMN